MQNKKGFKSIIPLHNTLDKIEEKYSIDENNLQLLPMD